MSRLVLLAATWNCQINYKNGDVGRFTCYLFEPLAHRRNVASLNLFLRYYFGKCSLELAQLVRIPYSRRGSTRYSNRLHDFSVTIPRCYKDIYVLSFFPRTARLWKCFPLTYDLNGLKSRTNRHLLSAGSFQTNLMYAFIFVFFFFVLLFVVTPCLVVAVQPCME